MSAGLDITQYSAAPLADRFNLPIQHWSPTSMSMLQRCPRQWQERYIHGRKERPAEALMVGQAVHRGAEFNFAQKIESHEDLNAALLLDFYEDSFAAIIEEEQEKAGENARWDTNPDAARARGRQMLVAYHNVVSPRVQPLAVETKISVDLGIGVPIEGRFDVEREESVIDIKTGRSSTRKPKEAWRIQAAVYGEAMQKPVEFHSVTATEKTGKVTIVTPLESELLVVQPDAAQRRQTRATLRALADLACFYMALLGPDEPWPTLGTFHPWACDFCGYRKDCPAWSTP